MRSKNGLAWLLIGFGALLILAKTGIFGFLVSLLIPIAVIGLGIIAWKNGSRFFGGILALIGGFMLLGKLSFLFVWIAAIALIVFGASMLGGRRAARM